MLCCVVLCCVVLCCVVLCCVVLCCVMLCCVVLCCVVLCCGGTILLTPGSYNVVVPTICVISGFRFCVKEVFGLLRCYAVLDGSNLRFGAVYKGQVSQLLDPSSIPTARSFKYPNC